MPASAPVTARLPRALRPDELAAYRRDGYVLVHDVLGRDELADLDRALHARWLEQLEILRAQPADPTDQRTKEERENHLHGLGADFPPARRLAEDERLLALVAPIVSPGISLFSAKLISKGPEETRNVCHWHQDDAYWWELSQSACRVSAWIPLLDTGPANGGLRVVRGDHRRDLVPHLPRSSRDHGACRLSFAAGEERLQDEVELAVPAGAVVLFSARTFHASSGNPSRAHRRAFILTYQEAGCASKAGEAALLRAP